ncbi:MAG: tRNA preQ1(34) S-adenosylmethionine ribosyltransferase-isomerase QueA [Rickettsiales bacterium]|nr:tRNA preQ1(34) S-adenosylmethionine ribosyltransferase-isomerase QueA [Rickettsiales bacterium]
MHKLSDFDYYLPEELIAEKPLKNRDESRLLRFAEGKISEHIFKDIINFVTAGDVIVFNNTKVIPARLEGSVSNSKCEVTLLKILSKDNEKTIWSAFCKPAKKFIIGNSFEIADEFKAKIIAKNFGEIQLEFNLSEIEFFQKLAKYGSMPLPPYIAKKRKPDESDKENYQTIYAEKEGSVAAPTAGLHFTEELLERLKNKGVILSFITLNVGAGTFLPVKVDNITDHKMHSEYFEISDETANTINQAKKQGKKIIVVGTTSLRALESAPFENGEIKGFFGDTDIFIYPSYKFKIPDFLITNFHLPKSTLMMLVSAFIGYENTKKLYEFAVQNKYRFFSYGDACLLELKKF